MIEAEEAEVDLEDTATGGDDGDGGEEASGEQEHGAAKGELFTTCGGLINAAICCTVCSRASMRALLSMS